MVLDRGPVYIGSRSKHPTLEGRNRGTPAGCRPVPALAPFRWLRQRNRETGGPGDGSPFPRSSGCGGETSSRDRLLQALRGMDPASGPVRRGLREGLRLEGNAQNHVRRDTWSFSCKKDEPHNRGRRAGLGVGDEHLQPNRNCGLCRYRGNCRPVIFPVPIRRASRSCLAGGGCVLPGFLGRGSRGSTTVSSVFTGYTGADRSGLAS
jgi:hypothetical protein